MLICLSIIIVRKESKEIVLGVFSLFYKLLEGAFCNKALISMGRNDRVKVVKILSQSEHTSNGTRQFQYYCIGT